MDFTNIYMSGHGNEYLLQVGYLLIYFVCDVNMTSPWLSRHWWAATASAPMCGEASLLDDAVDQWPTSLRTCVRTNSGHFEYTLWLLICFLCTWWTLYFTLCLMQWVIF